MAKFMVTITQMLSKVINYDPNTKYTCRDEKCLLIKTRCLQVRLLRHLEYRLLLLIIDGLQALQISVGIDHNDFGWRLQEKISFELNGGNLIG